MSNILQPVVNVVKNPAQSEVGFADERILIIGNLLAGGSATSGDLQQNILTENQANALFGENSIAATMFRVAREVNPTTQIDMIGLADNGAAVDATGSVAFTGTATASGTITVRVGDYKDNKYDIVVASGDTATVVGDKLEAAITADTKALVTGANTTGTVSFTAVNGGTEGNEYPITIEGSVAGITQVITAMTGGAGDPDTTDVLDVIGEQRYQTIITPNYARSDVVSVLEDRWNVQNAIQDGVLVNFKSDTFANALSTVQALDTQVLYLGFNKSLALKSPSFVVAAYIGAVRALRLTEGADLSDVVDGSTGLSDVIGGVNLASLPYFNTPLDSDRFAPMAVNTNFTAIEVGQLNDNGGSVLVNNTSNTQVLMAAAVTPYKTNANGVENDTWQFLNAVDTTSKVAEYFFNGLKSRFAQHRLTDGNLRQGRKTTNAVQIKAYTVSLYKDMVELDLVRDAEALDFFIANLNVEIINLRTGEIRITAAVPIVTQARTFNFPFNVQFAI